MPPDSHNKRLSADESADSKAGTEEELLSKLPSLAAILDVNPAGVADKLLEIPDESGAFLRFVDGKRSLSEVLECAEGGRTEALQHMWKLFSSGLLIEGKEKFGSVAADNPVADNSKADNPTEGVAAGSTPAAPEVSAPSDSAPPAEGQTFPAVMVNGSASAQTNSAQAKSRTNTLQMFGKSTGGSNESQTKETEKITDSENKLDSSAQKEREAEADFNAFEHEVFEKGLKDAEARIASDRRLQAELSESPETADSSARTITILLVALGVVIIGSMLYVQRVVLPRPAPLARRPLPDKLPGLAGSYQPASAKGSPKEASASEADANKAGTSEAPALKDPEGGEASGATAEVGQEEEAPSEGLEARGKESAETTESDERDQVESRERRRSRSREEDSNEKSSEKKADTASTVKEPSAETPPPQDGTAPSRGGTTAPPKPIETSPPENPVEPPAAASPEEEPGNAASPTPPSDEPSPTPPSPGEGTPPSSPDVPEE